MASVIAKFDKRVSLTYVEIKQWSVLWSFWEKKLVGNKMFYGKISTTISPTFSITDVQYHQRSISPTVSEKNELSFSKIKMGFERRSDVKGFYAGAGIGCGYWVNVSYIHTWSNGTHLINNVYLFIVWSESLIRLSLTIFYKWSSFCVCPKWSRVSS